jgi:hypothetical protein
MERGVVGMQSREVRTNNHVLACLYYSLRQALPAHAWQGAGTLPLHTWTPRMQSRLRWMGWRAISPGKEYYQPKETAKS